MRPTSLIRWTFLAVGALLVILNALHLTLGFARLLHALETEPIPLRFAEALKTAWLYAGTFGLASGLMLCWLSSDAAAGSSVARKAGMAIGVTLIAAGAAAYFATGKHPGLLFLSVFGVVVLVPLLVYRTHFQG